jgi:hypothetical protein
MEDTMTPKEYADYEQSVADFFEREGLNCLTEVGRESEPYFSWRPCDCCGSRLGGNRGDCNGYNPTTKEIQDGYAVCEDCIYYNEYGQLDDMTMLDMEDD